MSTARTVAVLDELGLDYRISSGEAVMLCPWHDDTKAGNFSVNTETGQCYCFACGNGGGLIALVSQVTGEDSRRARVTVGRAAMRRIGSPARAEEEPVTRRRDNDTTEIMNEAKLALFTDPPERELRKRSIHLDAARECGILWDPERKAWILPIRDPYSGELRGWQSKGRTGVRNYPAGVEKSGALFGLELARRLSPPRRLILVESPLDVARLLSAGIRGVVSSYGVQVSDLQLGLIHEFAEELVLALDNDSRGMVVSSRICHGYRDRDGRLVPAWRKIPVWVWNYGRSSAKDPGEQSDDELVWSLDNRISSVRVRFGV